MDPELEETTLESIHELSDVKTPPERFCQCCDTSGHNLIFTQIEVLLPKKRETHFLCKTHYNSNYKKLLEQKKSRQPQASSAEDKRQSQKEVGKRSKGNRSE